MNTVERVKDLCKQRKISIHKLELECGFANGYIGQLRKGTLPDDRLGKIAEYLGVSAEYLRTGEEEQLILSEQADLWIKIRNDKRLLHTGKSRRPDTSVKVFMECKNAFRQNLCHL